jgi:DnaK suppressor protein
MDEMRERLERELNRTVQRLRQLGGGTLVEELPGVIGDNSPFADEIEEVQVSRDREISFATRSLLVERANRLAAALERLGDGVYGLCDECGEPIAPARLKAVPEVTTCIRCQDRIEREIRRPEPVGAMFDMAEDEE